MNLAEVVEYEQAAVREALAASPVHLARILDPSARIMPQHALMGLEIAGWTAAPDARLTISAPPRTGKSWICMVWAPVFLLGRDPSREIIIACASDSLVTQHGTAIRDIIRAHGDVLGITVKRGSNRADYVETTEGGKLKLVGIDSQTTGFGADDLFIDDAFKGWEDAHSERIGKKRSMWLQSVALARLYPGARVIHTGTRWSKYDIHAASQRMAEPWPEIRIPAIADALDDPLGRAVGDPLGTPFLPDETREAALARWHKVRTNLDEVVWNTVYQGTPTDQQSLLVPDDVLSSRTWPAVPPEVHPVETIVQVDPSTGKGQEHNDTAGIIVLTKCDDGRVWITGDHTDRYPVEAWAARTLEVAAATGASRIRIEGNQGGEALRTVLDHVEDDLAARPSNPLRWPRGVRPTVDLHHATGSKWSRAAENGLAGLIKVDAVRLVGHLPRLIHELRTFAPGDESPGALDAAAHGVLDLLGRPLDRIGATDTGPSADDY